MHLHKPICSGSNGQFSWKRVSIRCFSSASQWIRWSHLFNTYLSTDQRNMTQVANRKTVKERKLATTSFAPFQSDLERLISAQRDCSSPVCAVVLSGNSYIAFLYTDKQQKDNELFCCNPSGNNLFVLGILQPLSCAICGYLTPLTAISNFSAGQERILCIFVP